MIQIAICDDEPFMLDDLFDRLNKYAGQRGLAFHISRFCSGQSVLESNTVFDVLFLDIRMQPTDGMEVARRLRAANFTGLLIFTTVLKENVFDSFEVGAFDYLIKPLEDKRFEHTMDRVVSVLKKRAQNNLLVKKGTECQVVPFSRITYCEIQGRIIHIHQTNGETVVFYEKMENLIKQVDERFFRCHRSYLINLDFILSFRKGQASLADGSKVPISRLREQELSRILLEHMKERNY